MKRRGWISSWRMSASLFVLWLLLVGELSVAHVLLAAALAISVPWFSERLRDKRGRPRRPLVMARLMAVVLHDIVVSNIEVARLILGPESRIRPGFIWLPLDIRNAYGITALASIITSTPGTVSCDLTADKRHLLVHCLNLTDPDAIVAQIKARYERPLMEIYPS